MSNEVKRQASISLVISKDKKKFIQNVTSKENAFESCDKFFHEHPIYNRYPYSIECLSKDKTPLFIVEHDKTNNRAVIIEYGKSKQFTGNFIDRIRTIRKKRNIRKIRNSRIEKHEEPETIIESTGKLDKNESIRSYHRARRGYDELTWKYATGNTWYEPAMRHCQDCGYYFTVIDKQRKNGCPRCKNSKIKKVKVR